MATVTYHDYPTLSSINPLKRHVFYTGEPKEDGKIVKQPLNPRNGRPASMANPATWGLHADAKLQAKAIREPGWEPGVGVVLGPLNDDVALCGVDFDGCLKGGVLEPWAEAIFALLDTYSEISPSGNGVKAFFRVTLADLAALREETGIGHKGTWMKSTHYGIELHLSASYYAVTGVGYGAVSSVACDLLRVVPLADLKGVVNAAERFKSKIKGKAGKASAGRHVTARPFNVVRDALMAIPNDGSNPDVESRDQWLQIGMAIHHASNGSNEGLEAWHEWSALWPAYDQLATTAAWSSFHRKTGRVRTGQSIINLAVRHGWRDLERIFRLYDDIEPEGGYPCDDLPGVSMAVLGDDRFGPPMMRRGKPVHNLNNAILYLSRYLDSILPLLRRNEMTGRDEWSGGAVDDEALSLARVQLERRGLETIRKELVADSVAAVARYQSYHPIRDELARVEWDGAPRLDTWLIRLGGADDCPYVRAVGRKFLIQMVARIERPGCKADHVLVLSGAQGIGKSTLCRILAGNYFSDNLPAINGGKDTLIHLRGKWLIELSEMAPSRKSEAEDLKAFLTATTDSYRDPYGRIESAWPRQCVFVGTTNSDEFLNDDTGGRRFWPVTIPRVIDTEGLAAEREQLLAEALAAFCAGESWHLSRDFETLHAKPMQDAAHVTDTWAEIVTEWLEKPIHEDFDEVGDIRTQVTVREVLDDALKIAAERQSTPVQRRAAAIMRGLGWMKSHTRSGNVWRRPEE